MVKNKIYSKDELLLIMSAHLEKQQGFAQKLLKKAEELIDTEEMDSETKKKRNHYINAYNTQVDAVSRTSAAMIRIHNSQLENSDEQESGSGSLID